MVDRYKNGKIEPLLGYKQLTRKGVETIVHINEEITKVGKSSDFEVVVVHNAHENPPIIDFEMLVVSENSSLPLHSYKFQSESFEEVASWVEAYETYIARKEINMMLMAKDLGRMLGFEADFSKGWEGFFKDMASHIATEDLERYIRVIDFEPLKIDLENELKMRGEI